MSGRTSTKDDKMELRRRFIPFALNVNSLYIINMVIQELLKGVRFTIKALG